MKIPGRLDALLDRWAAKKHDKYRVKRMRKRIQNHDFTILTNCCVGARIYQNLDMQYLSPTIGIAMSTSHFVKFCNNLKHYIGILPIEEKSPYHYPIAKIDDIEIRLVHYKTFSEFIEKWERRKTRINYDNIFVMMDDDENYTLEAYLGTKRSSEATIEEFKKIPYKKICFTTNAEYKNQPCFSYLKRYRKQLTPRVLTALDGYSGKRVFEYKFDFVKWLNDGPNR
jgi:uncharacterized protein (DUF1919 family)